MDEKNLVKKLRRIFEDRILVKRIDKLPYVTDATDIIEAEPLAVVFPINTSEVVRLVEIAREYKVPLYPRGGGSSLSGGPIPLVENGIVVSFTKMDKILEIRERDLQVLVEPGVVIDDLNAKLKPFNLFFPIDPASSSVATVGGVVGENAGGVRAVKYGVTKNWVLSLEVVTGTGEVIETGAKTFKHVVGYDLTSLFVGSEGTLGIITKALLRLTALPKFKSICYGFFEDQRAASEAIYQVITSGVDVTAIEFMDKNTLDAIRGFRDFSYKGESMVIAEVAGNDLGYVDHLISQIEDIFKQFGALEFKKSKSEQEYVEIWKIRKSAAQALSNIKPGVLVLDPTVPISKIPEYVEIVDNICRKYGVICATFGHAGDGNVHPNILFDPDNEEEVKIIEKVAREIYIEAINLGGTISGEHGVGVEKLSFLDLEVGKGKIKLFREIKRIFDPDGVINPGKAF